MPFMLWCTPVFTSFKGTPLIAFTNDFLLVLLTLTCLNCSRLSCQSRLLLCSQGSSLPPPWSPLCWSLSRRCWWLERVVGVWSQLGSPRYVSRTITLSAIKINCCRLMPLTVVKQACSSSTLKSSLSHQADCTLLICFSSRRSWTIFGLERTLRKQSPLRLFLSTLKIQRSLNPHLIR